MRVARGVLLHQSQCRCELKDNFISWSFFALFTGVFHFCMKYPWKACHGWVKFTRTTPWKQLHFTKLWAKYLSCTFDSLFFEFFCFVLMVPKDTASKNSVKTDVLSYEFSILHQGVCGSPQIANSDICQFTCNKPIIWSIREHNFQMVHSFLWGEFWYIKRQGKNKELNKAYWKVDR